MSAPRKSAAPKTAPKPCCTEHAAELRPIMVMPGRKVQYACDQGCRVSKALARRLTRAVIV